MFFILCQLTNFSSKSTERKEKKKTGPYNRHNLKFLSVPVISEVVFICLIIYLLNRKGTS